MNSSPHEICLITNNISFRPPLRRLDGALVDERRLFALFQQLDFDLYVKQDILWIRSSQQQENLQQKTTASLTHSFSSLWFSHGGSNDVILGVNGGTVSVAELACFFKSTECPTLQNKPKLFFFQACRGSGQDHSLTESGPVPSSSGTRMVSVSHPFQNYLSTTDWLPVGFVNCTRLRHSEEYSQRFFICWSKLLRIARLVRVDFLPSSCWPLRFWVPFTGF